ncbi:hypothetical protein [Pseudonocardia asaccharolytica]|uniref:Uncharacterized protein n=1 Tax=Pseudonocardia asaccharolytica DSM 44247 = NBRC 16224 TaxID=1123024 RepID=A0A511D453_9PSEU|nr:hypothetical protein [Pseudonocardia asaccharolytica]GEL19562.1 hypothetical protein PA7_33990 [Pseudonocardia asaccharolytica DSM 44247 = NBRC 16224]
MTGDRPLWLGVLVYVSITVVPTILFWAALRVPSVVAAWRLRRAPAPAGPPLESLVADLRRLRRELRGSRQRTRLRRIALRSAYDDVLADVCQAVGVDAGPLAATAETSSERAFARLLAEAGVEAAGIALDPPGSGRAVA